MNEQNHIYPIFDRMLTRKDKEDLLKQHSVMIWFTGLSGSGKSTLLKLLYKQEKASKGLVRVNNWNVSKLNNKETYKLRREIGVVFQDFKLLPYLTVYENIAYALEAIETPEEEIEERVI